MRLFETERLYVRRFQTGDEEPFFRLNGDEEIMRYIRAPKSREECDRFLSEVIDRYAKDVIDWRLAVLQKNDDAFVGSFAIIPREGMDELQLGYSFLKDQWGKGYATEVTMGGIRYCRDQLHLDSIAAVTEEGNQASGRVLLKCGFVLESQYEDQGKLLLLYRLSIE